MFVSTVTAQESVAVRSDLLLYGDNTEFHNPFREGETIFGGAVRVVAAIDLNDRVRVSIGGFGNQRFGSADAFEQVRPVLSFAVQRHGFAFILGTFPAKAPSTQTGPDRNGPHELLPPLQRETLAFERPYEAGAAWSLTNAIQEHSVWLNWQRLNRPEHRERFDGGVAGSLHASSAVSVPFQVHVVHEGGQLFAAGPVADSYAVATGVSIHPRMAAGPATSLGLFAVGS
jgi:hypothetical protein